MRSLSRRISSFSFPAERLAASFQRKAGGPSAARGPAPLPSVPGEARCGENLYLLSAHGPGGKQPVQIARCLGTQGKGDAPGRTGHLMPSPNRRRPRPECAVPFGVLAAAGENQFSCGLVSGHIEDTQLFPRLSLRNLPESTAFSGCFP